MSRKTLGILDGGRGGAVDRSWRRRGIRGVDKGDVAMHAAMLQVDSRELTELITTL